MKKSQTLLVVVLLFYVSLGLATCIYYYFFGSPTSPVIVSIPSTLSDEVVGVITESNELETSVETEPSTIEETVTVEETEASAEESIPETIYYSFKVINTTKRLHIRENPSLEANVLAKIPSKTTGYVLEKQDSWSHVIIEEADGTYIDGYAFNEYLDFTEIPKEELPIAYQ